MATIRVLFALACGLAGASLSTNPIGAQTTKPPMSDMPAQHSEPYQASKQNTPPDADKSPQAPKPPDSKVRALPNLSPRKGWPSPVTDNETFSYLLFDPLEYRRDKEGDVLRWDVLGWVGGDKQRFWFKTEGDHTFASKTISQGDLQLLYGRLIAPFYDFQIGLRYDQRWGAVRYNSRAFFVLGLQGLAPGRFSVEPALFISQEGNVSARFTASYDSQVTQRLILQPRFEISAAASKLKALGYEAGLNEVEFGLRLRYEIRREFAPYIGFSVSYTQGNSDNFAGNATRGTWQFSPVLGVRAWF